MRTNYEHQHKHSVHHILAHSYSIYFILFLVGVCFDVVFRFKIFTDSTAASIGAVFLVFGTVLVVWAQRTTRNIRKDEISKETFCHGPYCFTRIPTHWGLFFLMLGFAIIANALFVALSTFISFFVVKFVFQSKEERVLAEKYGSPYLEYKKSVRF